jgi:hypothetical protein
MVKDWQKDQAAAHDFNGEGVCHQCGLVIGFYASKLIEADAPHRMRCAYSPPFGCRLGGEGVNIPEGWGYYTDG